MLRRDGLWVFYRIQHLEKPERFQTDGRWTWSCFDHVGHPPFYVDIMKPDLGIQTHKRVGEFNPNMDEFTACGRVWQEIGEIAVFTEALALKCRDWLKLEHPGLKFRVIRVILDQKTVEV